jgi:hypothetical protein
MGDGKGYSERLNSFYEARLRPLEFGNAVADVILVPILALNLVGAISIKGQYLPGLVAIFAFVDVSSTAILLVAGYLGRPPKVACAICQGVMVATVSFWTCQKCGARLRPHKGTDRARQAPPN